MIVVEYVSTCIVAKQVIVNSHLLFSILLCVKILSLLSTFGFSLYYYVLKYCHYYQPLGSLYITMC